MNNKLFGTLGEKLKGNTLIIILLFGVIAAGTFSYFTISDINQKLKSQQLQNITQTPPPATTEDEAIDTQTEQNNVPITKPSPEATKKPTSETTEAEQEEAVPQETGFLLPVDGKIYASFTGNELVYNRTMDDWRTHNGIDISATKDGGVKAGASGTVLNVYQDGLLGTVIEIDHGKFIAKYCGLNQKTFVNKGDAVHQGQSIGTVGEVMLEVSDETHIHLEILIDGTAVDPMTIIN